MTKKLFWQDPYRTTLDTTVTAVEGDVITVAETIFFAEYGAQESDKGTIGGYDVLQTRVENHEIFYTLPAGHTLYQGDHVTIEIDRQRRYLLMRLHFAAEIVQELVKQTGDPLISVDTHISPSTAHIDFSCDSNIAMYFPEIIEQAKALIDANCPIKSAYSDENTEARYWEIDGFAKVDCEGTHLKRTGEIGAIKLKRKNVGDCMERIEISLVEG